MARELLVAFGLMLVIEGILYALAPDAMRRALDRLLSLPEQSVRMMGLCGAVIGLVIVVLARS